MFHEILKQLRSEQRHSFPQWKTLLIGGSPLPLQLARSLRDEFGLTILHAYGSTESCGALSITSPIDSATTFGSAGKPLEFVEVKIVDKDGSIVPVNESGEIYTRSPFVFAGYWDEAQKTAEVLDDARWYHMGDIGKMDKDGNIYVTERIKDMIIRGGENIYSSEIENLLSTHPEVEEVYVVGVPDQRMGEEVCASVKLKQGSTVTEDEIKGFCKDKISNFKIPQYILFQEHYPKTESGKIMKHKLREECLACLKLS